MEDVVAVAVTVALVTAMVYAAVAAYAEYAAMVIHAAG